MQPCQIATPGRARAMALIAQDVQHRSVRGGVFDQIVPDQDRGPVQSDEVQASRELRGVRDS